MEDPKAVLLSAVEALLEDKTKLFSLIALLTCVVYPLGRMFYNVFLHPLRKYPGPTLWAATLLPVYYHRITGQQVKTFCKLHEKYGPVVRTAPNELSYIDEKAWKDVYGFRGAGKGVFTKDPAQGGPEAAGEPGVFRSSGAEHTKLKKMFHHALSDKALKSQEPLVKGYCRDIVRLLDKQIEIQRKDPSYKINMVRIYNYATFDIMGDLTFGEGLGLLREGDYTPWVEAIIGQVKAIAYLHAVARWPILSACIEHILPPSVKKLRRDHLLYCTERVDRRMKMKTDRPDFWTHIEKAGEHKEVSQTQLIAVMSDMMVAGTETSGSNLAGLTYFAVANPEAFKKVVDEIRAFKSWDELTLPVLAQLPYMNAFINETFRLYPSVPQGNMRITPKEGVEICGQWVAGKVTVSCENYAATRSPVNWHNADKFRPERWLKDAPPEYKNDKRGTFWPFGLGPRQCTGQNLAHHMIRSCFSTVVWHYDITFDMDEIDGEWTDQKDYSMFTKKPLPCKVTPVKR